MTMKYRVVLHPSKKGFAVSCPGLPGCWSQGATEAEALVSIRDAIEDYLVAIAETVDPTLVREVEVSV